MSLDISKLENVRKRGGKVIARCPACAEVRHDQKGDHLAIHGRGLFGCVVYPGDSADAKEHRKRIFPLCGDREIKPLIVRSLSLGRLGRVNQSQSSDQPLETGLLGPLGRVFQTHLETERTHEGNEDRITKKLNDFGRSVLSVRSTPEAKSHKPQLLALLELPFVMVFSEMLQEIIFFCEDEAAKAALVEGGADVWSVYTKDELRVLIDNDRAQRFLPDELCKMHKLKRTFHGRIAP
jgi:hypothetical protein